MIFCSCGIFERNFVIVFQIVKKGWFQFFILKQHEATKLWIKNKRNKTHKKLADNETFVRRLKILSLLSIRFYMLRSKFGRLSCVEPIHSLHSLVLLVDTVVFIIVATFVRRACCDNVCTSTYVTNHISAISAVQIYKHVCYLVC